MKLNKLLIICSVLVVIFTTVGSLNSTPYSNIDIQYKNGNDTKPSPAELNAQKSPQVSQKVSAYLAQNIVTLMINDGVNWVFSDSLKRFISSTAFPRMVLNKLSSSLSAMLPDKFPSWMGGVKSVGQRILPDYVTKKGLAFMAMTPPPEELVAAGVDLSAKYGISATLDKVNDALFKQVLDGSEAARAVINEASICASGDGLNTNLSRALSEFSKEKIPASQKPSFFSRAYWSSGQWAKDVSNYIIWSQAGMVPDAEIYVDDEGPEDYVHADLEAIHDSMARLSRKAVNVFTLDDEGKIIGEGLVGWAAGLAGGSLAEFGARAAVTVSLHFILPATMASPLIVVPIIYVAGKAGRVAAGPAAAGLTGATAKLCYRGGFWLSKQSLSVVHSLIKKAMAD